MLPFFISIYFLFLLFSRDENPLLYFKYKGKIKNYKDENEYLKEKELILKEKIKLLEAEDFDTVDILIRQKFKECKENERLLVIDK